MFSRLRAVLLTTVAVPADFDFDVQQQKMIDRSQRYELTHGIVEFVAHPEYMVCLVPAVSDQATKMALLGPSTATFSLRDSSGCVVLVHLLWLVFRRHVDRQLTR